MSIYGVAFVDRHGNVGHWITGSGRDSDHVIPIIVVNIFIWFCFLLVGGLTTQAEPPPTRDANRECGTDSTNGGWLRRLVRRWGFRGRI